MGGSHNLQRAKVIIPVGGDRGDLVCYKGVKEVLLQRLWGWDIEGSTPLQLALLIPRSFPPRP